MGAELLVGETRDTNSGDLAIELTALGVEVRRLGAFPDRLEDVTEALDGGPGARPTWSSRRVAWARRPTT